jgi:dual oxidase maturation factor 1
MMRGWFDAFRENGGPTLYSYSNRTPVTADVSTLTLYIVFTTLFLAFIIIFPGVRRQRFTTFTSVLLSLFVGTAILSKLSSLLFQPKPRRVFYRN